MGPPLGAGRLLPGALLAPLAIAFCGDGSGGGPDEFPPDEPIDEPSGDGDSDDGRGDSEPPADPRGGSAVLALSSLDLTEERLCDFDGDGLGDNAIGDLGTHGAPLAAAALSAWATGLIDEGTIIVLLVIPQIDDVTVPEDSDTLVAFVGGQDLDRPRDPADDFSGDEPFYVDETMLGPCGEPIHASAEASIEDGALVGEEVTVPLPTLGTATMLRQGSMRGNLAPGARAGELKLCGYIQAADVGDEPGIMGSSDQSLLEAVLFGGESFGVSTIPGLSPDVDVDGDGLEQFVLDSDGLIETCVDGDSSTIAGRDCWRDPRMADGFAFTAEAALVSARLAGRVPGWAFLVDGSCDEGPPEQSFFDPFQGREGSCAGPGEECDPWLARPCCAPEHRCAGMERQPYRCSATCEPSACSFGEGAGTCVSAGGADICWPTGLRFREALCTPGEEGCETEYGATSSTACVEGAEVPLCAERCLLAETGCPEGLACFPRVFGPGGVCTELPAELRL